MSQKATGTRDEHYDLISVLYHALQGGDTLSQYIAGVQGDSELTQLFQDAQAQYRQIADRAKQLLAQRLG